MKKTSRIIGFIFLLVLIPAVFASWLYLIRGITVEDFYSQSQIVLSQDRKLNFTILPHNGYFKSGSPYRMTVGIESKTRGDTIEISKVYLHPLDNGDDIILMEDRVSIVAQDPRSSLNDNDSFVGGYRIGIFDLEYKPYRLIVETSKGDMINFAVRPFVRIEKWSWR